MLFVHKDSLYTKDNIVITVAGNIADRAGLESQIAAVFG